MILYEYVTSILLTFYIPCDRLDFVLKMSFLLSPSIQPSLQPRTSSAPTIQPSRISTTGPSPKTNSILSMQPSRKPTMEATQRVNFVPSMQPSLRPRSSFFNNELYVYAAVSLFLMIALICICMVVRQGCLNKMVGIFQPQLNIELDCDHIKSEHNLMSFQYVQL